ncbi:MAG: hypothetical protein WDZ40_04090 [Candidatus Spechtbacterales bacterium]
MIYFSQYLQNPKKGKRMKIQLTVEEWGHLHHVLDNRNNLHESYSCKVESLEGNLASAERKIRGALERLGARHRQTEEGPAWELKRTLVSKRLEVGMTQEEAASLNLFANLVNAILGVESQTGTVPEKIHKRLREVGAKIGIPENDFVFWILSNGSKIALT